MAKHPVEALWETWAAWAEKGRLRIGTKNEFGDQLENHGFQRKRRAGGTRHYIGLKVPGQTVAWV